MITSQNLASRSDLERQADMLAVMKKEERERTLQVLEEQARATPDGKYYLRALHAMLRSKLKSIEAGVIPPSSKSSQA